MSSSTSAEIVIDKELLDAGNALAEAYREFSEYEAPQDPADRWAKAVEALPDVKIRMSRDSFTILQQRMMTAERLLKQAHHDVQASEGVGLSYFMSEADWAAVDRIINRGT